MRSQIVGSDLSRSKVMTAARLAGAGMFLGVFLSALWSVLLSVGGRVSVAHAQQSAETIEVLKVRPNCYMIAGAGGNIGVQIGSDRVVLADAGAAEAADNVLAALRKLTDQPIRYIIDTSADADHVGGNERLAKAGRNIIA